jgi:chromosome segregation ATPase
MTRPELSRRVERAEEDLTAMFDTVLDIKETVDRHTEILAVHGHKLDSLKENQDTFRESLDSLKENQDAMRETQAQHGEVLAEILRRLDTR